MQKKLIALAVAGLVSGAAFAQTNVTVYGSMDYGYQYSKSSSNEDAKGAKVDGATFSGIEAGMRNGNRVGFRGTEALGNGLNAVFQAEFGFKGDVTGGLNNTRNAWLGLQHAKFGAATLGRQNSVTYDWVSKGFASDVTVVYPSNQLQGLFNQFHTSDRVDSSVKYVSPNFGGFTFATVYGFGEKVGAQTSYAADGVTKFSTDADTADAGRFTIGANYNNGPLDLALIYGKIASDDGLRGVTGASVDNGSAGWSFGGSYDFKVVKVFGQYQREHNELAKATPVVTKVAGGVGSTDVAIKTGNTWAAQDDTKTLWTVGVTVPVTKAGKVIVEYVNIDVDYDAAGVKNGEGKGWGVGYEHQFSKRTVGYAAVARTSMDNLTAKDKGFGAVQTGVDSNITSFGVGLRHTF